MAKDQVLIELQILQKGDKLSVVAKDTEKLAKAQDKQAKSGKKAAKSSEEVIKGQKGIHQTGLSSSKGFSKMNQMLNGGGGSSGLVAAYATLAANVFAASAAFNAFRGAAAFQQLGEGFTFMANQAGRTMELVVGRLKDVTDGALSTEQALQGASLAVSAGFKVEQLETLAKVAKGASLALGRNLGDAFDRLTRGAIKLEPEILDELGIMVRLDKATDDYAATLNKTSDQLTQFEKQTAFLTAINEQGIEKYGELADSVNVNPYDQLAASFGDLTKEFLILINKGLIPLIGFFSTSKAGLIGVTVLFASTIITTMVPALGQMVKRAQDAAAANVLLAEDVAKGAAASVEAAKATVLSDKVRTKTVRDLGSAVQANSGIAVQAAKTEKNLKAQLLRANAAQVAAMQAGDKAKTTSTVKRIAQIEAEILATQQLAAAETAQLTAGIALDRARTISKGSTIVAKHLEIMAGQGFFKGIKRAGVGIAALASNFFGASVAAKTSASSMTLFGRSAAFASGFVRILGAALLTAVPYLAMIAIAGAAVYAIFRKLNPSIELNSGGIETLSKVTETLADKYNQLGKEISGLDIGQSKIREYRQTAGVFQEIAGGINSVMTEISKADAATPKDPGKLSFEGIEGRNKYKHRKEHNAQVEAFKAAQGLAAKLRKEGMASAKASVLAIATDTSKASEVARTKLQKSFDIPEGTTLVDFIKNLEGDEGLKTLQTTFSEMETEVTKTATSMENLKKGISESETVMSKFLQAAVKKTPFDDLVGTFESLKTEMDIVTNDPDAGPEAMSALFKKSGKQMEAFGITAKTAATKIPELVTAFTNIQEKARTLQDDIKKLNAEASSIGAYKATSGSAMEEFLKKQNSAVTKQQEFNVLLRAQYDSMENGDAKRDLLLKLDAEDAALQAQLKTTNEITKTANVTRLKIEEKILNSQLSLNKAVETQRQTQFRLDKLKSGTGSKLTAADEFRFKIKSAQVDLDSATSTLDIKGRMIDAEKALMLAKAQADVDSGVLSQTAFETLESSLNEVTTIQKAANEADVKSKRLALKLVKAQGIEHESQFIVAKRLLDILGTEGDTLGGRFDIVAQQMQPFIDQLKELGNEGNLAGIAIEKLMALGNGVADFKVNVAALTAEFASVRTQKGDTFLESTLGTANPETIAKTVTGLNVMGQAFGAMGALIGQEAAQRTAAIDKAIAQEKRLGGNSEASIKKIAAMEGKKESIKRKSFEKQKKMQIAETIMNTASSAMTAFTTFAAVPPLAIAMAGMITAIGLKQVSIIKNQQYDGGGGSTPSKPSEISVGKRDNKVDVSKSATAGEASYLRGSSGIGSNANNFTPGGAGGMKRSYAAGGDILVGERGPEVISPTSSGYNVTPNDKLGGASQNISFTINAVDAEGVQDVLQRQRGNIIGMIREAAHEHGENFMEEVNIEAY